MKSADIYEEKESSLQILNEISPTDRGDETQRRFRYQHTATAYFALLMYLGKLPYKELICEHHEDILGVMPDSSLIGIQIKTQDPKLGLFSLKTESVKKSLRRFIELDKKYPNSFSKFIFAANGSFLEDITSYSVKNMREQMVLSSENKEHKLKPKDLDRYINDLCDDTKSTKKQVIDTLQKVGFQSLPSINDIDSKIIGETILSTPQCTNFTYKRGVQILDNVISVIYQKSSRKLVTPIEDYRNLLLDDPIVSENRIIINSKRITNQVIADILSSAIVPDYYLANKEDSALQLKENRQYIMNKKMNYGMIDPSTIALMDSLRESSEQYFIQLHHKGELEHQKFSHIQTIVWNQAIEAENKVKNCNGAYGEVMLQELEGRLIDIVKTRPKDIGDCPYEILKGQVAALAGDCKVKFSKTPKEGW